MDDIEKKRKYIYNLIHNNKDDKVNDTILYFIKTNDISYSENKNGYFINLMTIDNEHVNYLYNLVIRLEKSDNKFIDDINIINNFNNISEEDKDEDYEIEEEKEDYEELLLTENEKKLIEYTKMI